MTHVFDTPRLRVFVGQVTPTDQNTERQLFVGFRTDEDRPLPCATALVHDARDAPVLPMVYVDWLETTSEYRRMGFATELKAGLEAYYGTPLEADPGTSDGEAFATAWASRPRTCEGH